MNKLLLRDEHNHLLIDENTVAHVGQQRNTECELLSNYKGELTQGVQQLQKLAELLGVLYGEQSSMVTWRFVNTGLVLNVRGQEYLLVYLNGQVHVKYDESFYFTEVVLPLVDTFNRYLGTKLNYTTEFLRNVEARFSEGYVSQYKLHKLIVWLKEHVYCNDEVEFVKEMAVIFGDLVGSPVTVKHTHDYIELSYPSFSDISLYIFSATYDERTSDVNIRKVSQRCRVSRELTVEENTVKIINVFNSYYMVGIKNKKEVELPKNKVDYTLGRPIILAHRAKLDYQKKIQHIVEGVLTMFSPYAKTHYTYSNTTSSAYLEIKFKNCPNLYVSVRDHGGLKQDKYKVIYAYNNNLSNLATDLNEIVKVHIKETKYR